METSPPKTPMPVSPILGPRMSLVYILPKLLSSQHTALAELYVGRQLTSPLAGVNGALTSYHRRRRQHR